MPSPQLESIVRMLKARPLRENMTFPEARAAFERVVQVFPAQPDVVREPVDAAGVPAEWFAAAGASGDRLIYYLHGGGYVVGSVNTHRELLGRISRAAAARVLAIDYRLAPEHPFPAAIEDSVAAYRWLLSTGADPANIVIAGDSAGGGLTVATLVALRDAGDPLPAAAVCISPWTDMEGSGASMTTKAEVDPMILLEHVSEGAKAYLGGADPRNPLASPIHADLAGLPPLLVQVGTSEVLLDDSTRLAERARAAGVDVTLEPWQEMIHVWHFFALILPEGQQAIDRIGAFVRERVGAAAGAAQQVAS